MGSERNALIIHGGGLVDPSKEVMMRIARGLATYPDYRPYKKIFLGKYSFMSLYNEKLWLEYGEKLEESVQDKRGTFFGTCRGIDMRNPALLEEALVTLRDKNITTVIVCGGDGSSRNCAEISDNFRKRGIHIVFAVPLTVDGINGGYSIGLDQAVREAVRQIENVAATALATRDNGAFGVLAVELQGRNRDDILAHVLYHLYKQKHVADYELADILLRVVPANYATDEESLIEEINDSEKGTLLLFSEGATIKMPELIQKIKRKVRTVTVGHSVQSNGLTTTEDMKKYSEWLDDVVNIIASNDGKSYCIVNDGIMRYIEPIYYYATMNPRENQQVTLSRGLEMLLKGYMA